MYSHVSSWAEACTPLVFCAGLLKSHSEYRDILLVVPSLTRVCESVLYASVAQRKGFHRAFTFVMSTSGVVFQDFEKAMEWVLARTHTYAHAHTHAHRGKFAPHSTSKLAVPWETSNAGEAIKRQKLFSVRPWFIWLKNETTNPTDIIFPSQGLLYQAEPKLLPGGNPLKSRKAQPEELELSCSLLSFSLSSHCISHSVSSSFSVSLSIFQCAIPSLTNKNKYSVLSLLYLV